ncbi:PorV/PorQ family protein [Portibacter lacus]|nr:PorV/PorQ family protein [Portibacter lacus]
MTLGAETGDGFITSIAAFKKLGGKNTLGIEAKHSASGKISQDLLSARYFLGKNAARESLLSIGIVRKWTYRFASAIALKYIYSNIGYTTDEDESLRVTPGQGIAGDLSFSFIQPIEMGGISSNLMLGLAVTNLGPRVVYSSNSKKEFLPANIGLGVGWAFEYNESSSISLLADANKLLVPSPNDFYDTCDGLLCSHKVENNFLKAAWRSFYDADGGFSEELAEIYYSFGVEYEYQEKWFLRSGYLYEHADRGNRKILCLGIGYGFRNVVTDLSFQIPIIEQEVNDNQFRFSIGYRWEKSKG